MKELIKQLTERQQREFAIWCARRCKTDVKEIGLYIDAIEGYYLLSTHTKEQMVAARAAAARAAAARAAAYWDADWAVYLAYWVAYWAADSAADSAADTAADCAADRKKEVKAQKAKIKRMIQQKTR